MAIYFVKRSMDVMCKMCAAVIHNVVKSFSYIFSIFNLPIFSHFHRKVVKFRFFSEQRDSALFPSFRRFYSIFEFRAGLPFASSGIRTHLHAIG